MRRLFVNARCMLCESDEQVIGTRVAPPRLKVERWYICHECLQANPDAIGDSLRRRAQEQRHGIGELQELAEWLLERETEGEQEWTLLDWNNELRRFRERARQQTTS